MGRLHHSLSRKVIYNQKGSTRNFLGGVFSLIVMKLYISKKVIISMSIDFSLDSKLASKYKSNAQKIRVMSESWVGKNLFCPSCGNPHLSNLPNNMPVADLRCEHCGEVYELKVKKENLGIKLQLAITLR